METDESLESVLATGQLAARGSRTRDDAGLNAAVAALNRQLTDEPDAVLQRLVETARDICDAGSAGASLLEDDGGRQVLRCRVVAGELSSLLRGAAPRNFSPCGVVLDREMAQLFRRPARFYKYLDMEPAIEEALLVPFFTRGEAVGTLWVATHEPGRRFDAEDARVLSVLCEVASAAYVIRRQFQQVVEARERLADANRTLEQWIAERTEALVRRTAELRTLAVQFGEAEDRERKRLAKMLHDDLQPLLVAGRLGLIVARARGGEGMSAALDRVESHITEAISATRTLATALSPPVLEREGLRAAVRWLADRMESLHGLLVTVDDGSAEEPPQELRGLLYRAAHEFLFNVVKHAGASEARVELSSRGDCFHLVVSDGGAGCAEDPLASRDSFGLASLREHAAYLGGRLAVTTTPGAGCRVEMELPVARE